jgi:choline-sulfatase
MTAPNIVLITTDQQRFDAAGGRGPSFLRTPHFDDLRRQGITFASAYASCPVCVPSRLTIMTGKNPQTHGMTGNGVTSDFIGRENTLPTLLRDAGYQTAAIGKMHFGPQRTRHGFDEMILPDDYYRHMNRRGYDVQPMRHGLGQNELYPGMATVPESLTLTSWIAEQCVEYIRERRDPGLPFFLWCSFSKPHPPLDPPEPYYSMYRDSPIPDPIESDWSRDENAPHAFVRARQAWSLDLIDPSVLRAARAAYYGLITQIDYNMGRVFAALQDRNLFHNTLVVYASDHGEYLGDHRTGSKVFFHEPSAHVPLVVRLPKNGSDRCAGSVVSTAVSLADLLPTLVQAGGGHVPADVDGTDLIALARQSDPAPRYIEGIHGGNIVTGAPPAYLALTDGRWKYIWYPEGPSEQLFDLETDPREEINLAGEPDAADAKNALKTRLLERHGARGSPWVQEGGFVSIPPRGDTEQERRNQSWPGYHTEYFAEDVRH